MKFFVISDLHGDDKAFYEISKHWNEEEEKLIFIGDLVSRGPNGLLLMKIAMNLVKEKKAIWIKGNHEVMLDEFLYEPQIYKSYLSDNVGGMQTIENFKLELLNKYSEEELKETEDLVKLINKEYEDLIDFIANLPYVHIKDDLMFVHAAVNCDTDKVSELDSKTLTWGHSFFYQGEEHKFPHIVIFGHMPTQNLNASGSVHIFPCKKKIAIDVGGFIKDESASINAIKIDSNNPSEIEVIRYYTNKNELEVYNQKI